MMTVNSDNALNCPTKDSFGVAGLAESFANIIMRCDTIEDGLVMAVCGEWGVGKTSFLGFVKTHLNDEEKKPIILDFNPWLFSDRDDLVKRYLIELAKVLSPRQMKRDACRLKFSEAVNNFADISGELLEFAADLAPVPLLATGVRTLKNLSKQSVENLSKQPPLSEQKAKIEDILRKSKQKIVVIIDDLDRLDPDEVMEIFRLVKSVADFPNIVYVLSFDRHLVADIINQRHKLDGEHYLEKIVQYSLDLPKPRFRQLLKLLNEKIEHVIQAEGGKEWDNDRGNALCDNYLKYRMRTPRQALRLANTFVMHYPLVRGEVDPIDFIAIETLRMLDPKIYYAVRNNQVIFVEQGQKTVIANRVFEYVESILDTYQNDERKPIKNLLKFLFPIVSSSLTGCLDDNDQYSKAEYKYEASQEQIADWRGNARICSSQHFDRYFQYGIPLGEFSDAEIISALELTRDKKAFKELLTGYKETLDDQHKSRIPEFLERVEAIIGAGKVNQLLPSIIHVLILYGEELERKLDRDNSLFFNRGNTDKALQVLKLSLQRIERGKIFKTLETAFKQTKAIYVFASLMVDLSYEHGLFGWAKKEFLREGRQPCLTTEQMRQLKNELLKKLMLASNQPDELFNHPYFYYILDYWHVFSEGGSQTKDFIRDVTQSNKYFVRLVDIFCTKWISLINVSTDPTSDGRRFEYRREGLDIISKYIDLDLSATRAKNLLKTHDMTNHERQALEAFVQACDGLENETDGGKKNA